LHVTFDVKFLMWITSRHCGPCRCASFFLTHKQWMASAQAEGVPEPITEPFPQACPHAAHSTVGVSAQAVHRPVHSTTGRRNPVPRDCPSHPVERM
jgi:hypothetical protein